MDSFTTEKLKILVYGLDLGYNCSKSSHWAECNKGVDAIHVANKVFKNERK
jgi:hypothetical protein